MPVLTACSFKNKFPFIMVFRHIHTDNVQINFHSAPSKRPCKPQVFWIRTIFNLPNFILYNCSEFGFNYFPLFLFCFTVHTNRLSVNLNKNTLHLSHECESRLDCPRYLDYCYRLQLELCRDFSSEELGFQGALVTLETSFSMSVILYRAR